MMSGALISKWQRSREGGSKSRGRYPRVPPPYNALPFSSFLPYLPPSPPLPSLCLSLSPSPPLPSLCLSLSPLSALSVSVSPQAARGGAAGLRGRAELTEEGSREREVPHAHALPSAGCGCELHELFMSCTIRILYTCDIGGSIGRVLDLSTS